MPSVIGNGKPSACDHDSGYGYRRFQDGPARVGMRRDSRGPGKDDQIGGFARGERAELGFASQGSGGLTGDHPQDFFRR